MDVAKLGSAARELDRCLEDPEILDFAAGLLGNEDINRIERHLATCDRCAELTVLAASNAPAAADTTPLPHTVSTPQRPPGRSPTLQPGTTLNQTYRVVRFVGWGGMGDVYEVAHARLAGRYAAKILSIDLAKNAQALSRFRREAQIASGLSDSNVVQVIDFGELQDGRPFLVMEFLDGRDLAEILSAGPLPLSRVMHLVEQIASALTVLHGCQIVHRDLKPQNIFVLPAKAGQLERVKLVDFGLAKRGTPSMAVTQERSLVGTPQYMAPEQAIGKTDCLGPEIDQFALAALIYEMLGGKPAFDGDVLSSILYRIVHESPTPLSSLVPNLPPRFYAAIDRALAKRPEDRFPSIASFVAELKSQPSPDAANDRPRSRARIARTASIAVSAAVALVVVASVFVRSPRQPLPVVQARSTAGALPVAESNGIAAGAPEASQEPEPGELAHPQSSPMREGEVRARTPRPRIPSSINGARKGGGPGLKQPKSARRASGASPPATGTPASPAPVDQGPLVDTL